MHACRLQNERSREVCCIIANLPFKIKNFGWITNSPYSEGLYYVILLEFFWEIESEERQNVLTLFTALGVSTHDLFF